MGRRPVFRSPCTGFTLMELMVVLAILAALVAVGASTLRIGPGAGALKAASQDVQSLLRDARNRAVATGRPVTVSIAPAARTVRMETQTPLDLPSDLTLAVVTGRPVGNAAAEAGTILFYPDGSSTGGEITLARGAAAVTLRVNWVTGHARRI